MKTALITGPTGAVGMSLIYELINNDYEVYAVCHKSSTRANNLKSIENVKIVYCDLNELLTLKTKLPHIDVFYHFAWDGTYGIDRQDILKQTNNIVYTLEAVQLAKALGCETFVGAGSQSEFGHVEGKLSPTLPCSPDNGYGIAKLAAGNLSRLLCKQLHIKHIWCRIISLYGPFDGEYTLVMGTIIKLLKGVPVKFTKAEQIWDYIYNKDAARAFRLVAEKGKDGAIYCLGTGRTKKLKEYINIIKNNICPEKSIKFGELEYYDNQVMHLEADITNLTNDTGFEPMYSFEQGIIETINWVKMHKLK